MALPGIDCAYTNKQKISLPVGIEIEETLEWSALTNGPSFVSGVFVSTFSLEMSLAVMVALLSSKRLRQNTSTTEIGRGVN